MQAIELLLNRVSCGRLTDPAPTAEQREVMYKAALRAADHANLRPWRFLEIEGDGLDALGELIVKAALVDTPELDDDKRARLYRKPRRAPLVIAAIAKHIEHPKVPQWEQLLATGAAVQNLINGAFAQGVGAYWRTGSVVESEVMREGLGLEPSDSLIGFVYLGTPAISQKPVPELKPADFFAPWPSK